MQNWRDQTIRGLWPILRLAAKKFSRIHGAQWAGAFAFNAFFSLFPLVILFVTIASGLTDREWTGEIIITYINRYIPISGEMRDYIVGTISGVVEARKDVGAFAFLTLVWVALQCFTTLIYATNRAWGSTAYKWWRSQLRSLVLLAITAGAVIIGMTATLLLGMAKDWLISMIDHDSSVYTVGSSVIRAFVVFLTLSLLYRLAPRRRTLFAEVWVAALAATVLFQSVGSLFVIYLKNFATLNAVYGTFGGIMALLLWIYLSGCIFIIGACLCAAQVEIRSASAEATWDALQRRIEP